MDYVFAGEVMAGGYFSGAGIAAVEGFAFFVERGSSSRVYGAVLEGRC